MSQKRLEEPRYVSMEVDGTPVITYSLSEIAAVYDRSDKERELVNYRGKNKEHYDFGY